MKTLHFSSFYDHSSYCHKTYFYIYCMPAAYFFGAFLARFIAAGMYVASKFIFGTKEGQNVAGRQHSWQQSKNGKIWEEANFTLLRAPVVVPSQQRENSSTLMKESSHLSERAIDLNSCTKKKGRCIPAKQEHICTYFILKWWRQTWYSKLYYIILYIYISVYILCQKLLYTTPADFEGGDLRKRDAAFELFIRSQ